MAIHVVIIGSQTAQSSLNSTIVNILLQLSGFHLMKNSHHFTHGSMDDTENT